MMRRLTEYSAIIIRMLASRSMIFRRTLSQPVMKPATAPASVPPSVDMNGSCPLAMSVAATAPPIGKLPSTVRSGKLRMRKEISTPSATRLKIKPISRAPSNENSDMTE